jgi:hypothetical protein
MPLVVESGNLECGVVVGQTTLFHFGFNRRRHQGEPLLPQDMRSSHMRSVGDGLVPRPHPRMIGDQVSLTPDLDPVQVGADQHPATDR